MSHEDSPLAMNHVRIPNERWVASAGVYSVSTLIPYQQLLGIHLMLSTLKRETKPLSSQKDLCTDQRSIWKNSADNEN